MAIKNTKLGGTDNIDGEIIYAADVNDTNNAIISETVRAFEETCQNRYAIIYDSDVTEFNTLQADGWVAGFETLSASGDYDSGNSTCNYDSQVGCIICDEYDDFGDASIDATKWNTSQVSGTATWTETSGQLRCVLAAPAQGRARAEGSGGSLDLKTADCTILIRTGSNAEISSNDFRLNIVDSGASNRDEIFNVTSPYYQNAIIELYVDVSNTRVKYRRSDNKRDGWSGWSSWVTLTNTGASSNWYFELDYASTSSNDTMTFDYIKYVQGAVTQTFQSNGYNHLSANANYVGTPLACNSGLFSVNTELNGATPTWSISADDGSNFSTITDRIGVIANTGNQIVLKGSITTSTDRPSYIYEFGVKGLER